MNQKPHWTLDSIPWHELRRERVAHSEELFYMVAGASFIETTSDLYTRNLVQHFADNAEVSEWLEQGWEPEELQHGRALRERNVRWQRKHEALVAKRLLGVSAAQAAGDVHAIAGLESRCILTIRSGAHGFDCTGAIGSRRPGQERLSRIRARAHVGINRIDADGAQANDNLPRGGFQVRHFFKLHDLGSAEFLYANRLHRFSCPSALDVGRRRADSANVTAPRNYLSAGDC